MLQKLLSFLHPLGSEPPEIRISYTEFQKNNQRNLTSIYNLMVIPITFMSLMGGIFNEVPFQILIQRSISTFTTILAYFIRNKYPAIQKLILVWVIGSGLFFFGIHLDKIFDNHIQGGFIAGNALGICEISLLMAFKDVRFRSGAFVLFTIIKIFAFRDELSIDAKRTVVTMTLMIFILILFLFWEAVDIQVFKIIKDLQDKFRKFQELFSNDIHSSVVIVNSTLAEILYSNESFRVNFKNEEPNREINSHVFNKIIIQKQTNLESNRETKISLTDFLKEIELQEETMPGKEPTQALSVSGTYQNTDNNEQHFDIKLRKLVWDGANSYAIVLNDVTDKQNIEALKLADEQKDRVIATVSHELRNPINGILGLLQMVTLKTIDPVCLDYLEYAKSCSKLLLYLVNSILDLSQLRNNKIRISKDSFNLNKVIKELKFLFTFQCQQKGIEFLITVDSTVPKTIYTDKYKLIEILINLLGNAIKFTFTGSVTLSVLIDENDQQKLKFCVTDTGIGIHERDKTKLFKMFGKVEQTDRSINTHGVGLGLTIANELVKALNDGDGSGNEAIHFESQFGTGSKFWFQIDAICQSFEDSILSEIDLESANQKADSSNLIERSQRSLLDFNKKIAQLSTPMASCNQTNFARVVSPKNMTEANSCKNLLTSEPDSNKQVLIVDDSPFNLMAANLILEQLGYSTKKAYNGRECLDILEKNYQIDKNKKFCLILTDIQMPVLDGLEMSRIINSKIEKGELYNIPIVAVTAREISEEEKLKYEECGIKYFLEKPLVPEAVKRILNILAS